MGAAKECRFQDNTGKTHLRKVFCAVIEGQCANEGYFRYGLSGDRPLWGILEGQMRGLTSRGSGGLTDYHPLPNFHISLFLKFLG